MGLSNSFNLKKIKELEKQLKEQKKQQEKENRNAKFQKIIENAKLLKNDFYISGYNACIRNYNISEIMDNRDIEKYVSVK